MNPLQNTRTQSVVKTSLKIPKGNQNPYIKEEQTTQWPKERVQKGKQRYLQNIHIKINV